MEKMSEEKYSRQRLVVLGSGGVGKSSVISRFLNNNFSDRYKETVEDLYCREYNILGYVIKVDILDTAGNLSFPAMRKLAISNANAFLLVYAVDNRASFEEVKQIQIQIHEQRCDYDELPIVIIGNKADLPEGRHEVSREEVRDWLEETWHENQAHLEVSAKDNTNVVDIFKKFLQLSKIAPAKQLSPLLKRRLSAHSLDTELKQFKEKEDTMKRSRSLMRRPSKPRVKHASHMKRDDCLIS